MTVPAGFPQQPAQQQDVTGSGARLAKGGALVGGVLGAGVGTAIGLGTNKLMGITGPAKWLNLAGSIGAGTLGLSGGGAANAYVAGQLGSAMAPSSSLFDQAVLGRTALGAAKSTALGPVLATASGALGAVRGATEAGATHLIEKFSQDPEPYLEGEQSAPEERWRVRLPSPAARGMATGAAIGAGVGGLVGGGRSFFRSGRALADVPWAALDGGIGAAVGGAGGAALGGGAGMLFGSRNKHSQAVHRSARQVADTVLRKISQHRR